MKLNWCPHCKEASVTVKHHKGNRIEICLNKGCGYRKELGNGKVDLENKYHI